MTQILLEALALHEHPRQGESCVMPRPVLGAWPPALRDEGVFRSRCCGAGARSQGHIPQPRELRGQESKQSALLSFLCAPWPCPTDAFGP